MKKTVKIIPVVLSLLCVVSVLLCSCGAAAKSDAVYSYADEEGLNEVGVDNSVAAPAEKNAAETDISKIADAASRKLIRDASLSVQTEKFDDFTASLEAKLGEVGGYVQSSDISGNDYYYNSMRCAEYTLRVPAEKLDDFLTSVNTLGTVTSKQISVKDVTTEYIDTESRIKALETEQEALLAILKKAETVTDIIEVQNRLTEVRAELESNKTAIKRYDELIAYSTVKVSVSEVERADTTEQRGFGAEIKRRLSDNLYNIGRNIRDFAVWFISSLPYFAIIGVLAAAVIIITVKTVKKRRVKKAAAKQKANEEQ